MWPQVLTVFGNVLGIANVLVVFLWCFGGVLVTMIEEIAFFEPNWLTYQYQISVNGHKNFAIALFTSQSKYINRI